MPGVSTVAVDDADEAGGGADVGAAASVVVAAVVASLARDAGGHTRR